MPLTQISAPKHLAANQIRTAVQAGLRADDIMVALLENSHMEVNLGHGVDFTSKPDSPHSGDAIIACVASVGCY